jgi:hypothetical protein
MRIRGVDIDLRFELDTGSIANKNGVVKKYLMDFTHLHFEKLT